MKNGEVVYPNTLFDEIEEMRKCKNIRLYSYNVNNRLFIITTSQTLEEYKDGKFISYSNNSEIVASKDKLSEFIKKVPEIDDKYIVFSPKGVKRRIKLKNK